MLVRCSVRFISSSRAWVSEETPPVPSTSLTAFSVHALSAGLVAEEARDVAPDLEQVVSFRDEDRGPGAEHRARLLERLEVDRNVEAGGREEVAAGATRRHRRETPSLAHAAAALEQLAQRRSEGDEHDSRLRHVAAHADELVPREARLAEAAPPRDALAQDAGGVGEGLHVVHQRRLIPQPRRARKGRLVAGLAAPVLHALEQRGLLAEDVAAGRDEDLDVETQPASEDVVAQRSRGARLVDRALERMPLRRILVADEDEAALRAYAPCRERHPLEHEVRQVAQDLPILEGSGLALVGVADDEAGRRRLAGHERPLAAGRKAGAAHAPQPRLLEQRRERPALAGERRAKCAVALRLLRVDLRLSPSAPRPLRRRSPVLLDRSEQILAGSERENALADGGGGCGVAAPEAGHLAQLHVVATREQLAQPGAGGGSAGQGAGEVSAELHDDALRRSAAEVGVEGGEALQAVQRYSAPPGQLAQRRLAEPAVAFL